MPAAEHASPRRGVLSASFMAAVLLHAALLFGFTPEQPGADLPATRAKQGIEVDISSFSTPGPVADNPAQAKPVQQQEAAQEPPAAAVSPEPPPSPAADARPIPKRHAPQAKAVSRSAAGVSASVQATTAPDAALAQPAKAGDRARPESEVHNPKPVYPLLARQRGQEGETLLLVSVDATGRVLAVDVERSSGFTLLDDAAIKGVKQWRFRPAIRNGIAVAGAVLLPIIFRLQ